MNLGYNREMSSLLLLKLIVVPLAIAATTKAARRWGVVIGGLLIGMPLTSGPVSIFFALEQGRAFAASAARSTLLGIVAVAVFCAGYAVSARGNAWQRSAIISILFYCLTVSALSFTAFGLWTSAAVVGVALLAALLLIGRPAGRRVTLPAPWWDIPLRITAATTLLILITGSAGVLGPQLGGLLTPFPIFTFVMAIFTHAQAGPLPVRRMLHGVMIGLFSFCSFFVIVNLLVERIDLWAVYTLAAATSISVNSFSMWLLREREKLGAPQAVQSDG